MVGGVEVLTPLDDLERWRAAAAPRPAGRGRRQACPARPWEEHKAELAEYSQSGLRSSGPTPDSCSVVCWVYRTEIDAEAQRITSPEYGDSALRHYQFLGERLQALKGYEAHAKMRVALQAEFEQHRARSTQNNIWGSPKTCLEKLERINAMMFRRVRRGVLLRLDVAGEGEGQHPGCPAAGWAASDAGFALQEAAAGVVTSAGRAGAGSVREELGAGSAGVGVAGV